MSEQLELPFEGRGEAPSVERSVETSTAPQEKEGSGASGVMERAVSRPNMLAAYKRVRENKGSPGIDGMTVEALPAWLQEHWAGVREQLLLGTYQPQPVKRQLIPKAGGGERELGIPTVVDRLIQQALLQVLQPIFDPTFSDHSYGFRPGRRAHDAVRRAQRYVQEGRRWVVDVDLEKFFDRVNHDLLMGRLAKRIEDKRVLRLIRRYLEAGVMVQGVVMERHEGTPQGGPMSPLLANLLLDEVDQDLEKRGHAFVRYADDGNVYVRSKRAGERVMALLHRLYGDLKLRINESKSAVARVWDRKFLGFSLWVGAGKTVRVRVAEKALNAMKQRVRSMTRRLGGRSLGQVIGKLRPYLLGWKAYFRLAETPQVFRELDEWIRHRLRAIQLKQWKRGRTTYRELVSRGLGSTTAARIAANTRRWWKNSGMALHIALPNRWFAERGLPSLGA
ncbi:MAG: group II intron reverse transcriptase/maturase [Candidatus Eisenbacteria bacterium]|nr:group II intron reverse transcriptase/maturase [Candidatus Eisenbacteria bacterium]